MKSDAPTGGTTVGGGVLRSVPLGSGLGCSVLGAAEEGSQGAGSVSLYRPWALKRLQGPIPPGEPTESPPGQGFCRPRS